MASEDVSDVVELLQKTGVGDRAEDGELSFAGKGWKLDTAEDAKEIVDRLREAKVVTSLRLSGNTIGKSSAEAIAEQLKHRPEFQRALWSDIFTGRLRPEIPPSLESLSNSLISANSHLVELDLSDNAFGADGVNGIVNLLTSPVVFSLKVLQLNNNGLGISGAKVLSKALLDCHEKSVLAGGSPLALRVFISGRNRLENQGAEVLAQAFRTMGSLQHIAMPQNGIQHEGISHLAQCFSANKQLRILNFNDNTFTELGASAMAEALPDLAELEELNFGDCLLSTQGAVSIANSIKDRLDKIKVLDLSYNEIGPEAILEIVKCCLKKPMLHKIELNGNSFGSEGVDTLKSMLTEYSYIDCLGSMSADEEEGEEGDDDRDSVGTGSDHDENVVEIDSKEGDVIDDPDLQVRGHAISTQPEESTNDQSAQSINDESESHIQEQELVSIEGFVLNPSDEALLGLGPDRVNLITQYYSDKMTTCSAAARRLMDLSLILTDATTQEALQATFQCIDSLLTHALGSGICSPELLANDILIHMGLLKSEDKVQPVNNLYGPLLVLQHIIAEKLVPISVTKFFQVFLARPSNALDNYSTIRHQVLQTIYQTI